MTLRLISTAGNITRYRGADPEAGPLEIEVIRADIKRADGKWVPLARPRFHIYIRRGRRPGLARSAGSLSSFTWEPRRKPRYERIPSQSLARIVRGHLKAEALIRA